MIYLNRLASTFNNIDFNQPVAQTAGAQKAGAQKSRTQQKITKASDKSGSSNLENWLHVG